MRRFSRAPGHFPTSDEGIDRIIDLMEAVPAPVDDIPGESVEAIARSLAAGSRSRHQAGSAWAL